MDFKGIVKKTIDDSKGKRFVYVTEDNQELEPGLYQIRIAVGRRARWYSVPREMLICKNHDKGIVHDMYVDKKIDILELGEVYPHHQHKFHFIKDGFISFEDFLKSEISEEESGE